MYNIIEEEPTFRDYQIVGESRLIKQILEDKKMMFFGGWMIIFWVVIIALIVWGVIALVRRGTSVSDTPQKRDPLDIARERYARGEITKEEFEEIKRNLF